MKGRLTTHVLQSIILKLRTKCKAYFSINVGVKNEFKHIKEHKALCLKYEFMIFMYCKHALQLVFRILVIFLKRNLVKVQQAFFAYLVLNLFRAFKRGFFSLVWFQIVCFLIYHIFSKVIKSSEWG